MEHSMKVVRDIEEMVSISNSFREEGKRIGFVPTMGYLHEGHLSLVRLVKEKSDIVVVSIFVNPLQFGPKEDFKEYPKDLDRDIKLLEELNTDIAFVPDGQDMYPEPYFTNVEVTELGNVLCGRKRPGFFKGVATVCTKLFNIVKPHIAVFGQKDAQQAVIITKMVKDLNMDIEIITGPTVREEDGLAVSSRNIYLCEEERKDATVLYHSLKRAESMVKAGERDGKKIKAEMQRMIESKDSAKLEYISIVDTKELNELETLKGEILIALACHFGKARLIDNIVVAC